MDETTQEDWLDRQLREAAPYIDDDRFTARVLAVLPPPRAGHQSLRTIILVGLTALGSALAYTLSDGGRFVAVEMARLSMLPALWLYALAFGSGLLVMTGGLIAAMSKMSERAILD
jgi:hypothetical protein